MIRRPLLSTLQLGAEIRLQQSSETLDESTGKLVKPGPEEFCQLFIGDMICCPAYRSIAAADAERQLCPRLGCLCHRVTICKEIVFETSTDRDRSSPNPLLHQNYWATFSEAPSHHFWAASEQCVDLNCCRAVVAVVVAAQSLMGSQVAKVSSSDACLGISCRRPIGGQRPYEVCHAPAAPEASAILVYICCLD